MNEARRRLVQALRAEAPGPADPAFVRRMLNSVPSQDAPGAKIVAVAAGLALVAVAILVPLRLTGQPSHAHTGSKGPKPVASSAPSTPPPKQPSSPVCPFEGAASPVALAFDATGRSGIAAGTSWGSSGGDGTTGVTQSSDGGQIWGSVRAIPGNLRDADALDQRHALVATDVGLFATQDGGASWTLAERTTSLCQIAFWDPSTGLLADHGRLLSTTDGGRTSSPTSLDAVVYAVRVEGAAGALAAGPSGVFMTSDGGATWRTAVSVSGRPLDGFQPSIATAPAGAAAVVYNVGTVAHSEFGGLLTKSPGGPWRFAADGSPLEEGIRDLGLGVPASHQLPPLFSTSMALAGDGRIVVVAELNVPFNGLFLCEGPDPTGAWTHRALPAQVQGAWGVAVAANGGAIEVASYANGALTIVRSDDSGRTWSLSN